MYVVHISGLYLVGFGPNMNVVSLTRTDLNAKRFAQHKEAYQYTKAQLPFAYFEIHPISTT